MNHDTTPTPRTDAAWNSDVDGSELEIVSKQLERELTEKTNQLANSREAYMQSVERDDFLTQENARIRDQRDRLIEIAEWFDERHDDPIASVEERKAEKEIIVKLAELKAEIK